MPFNMEPLPDIHTLLERMQSGVTSAQSEMERAIAIASSPRCADAFLSTRFSSALTEASSLDMRHLPLAGLAVSVKDLFDIKGQATRAASLVLGDAQAAESDCLAVQRLKQAGGIVLGRTNMTEFAFSGVGINPHFGTPANACSTSEPRIPGGSSSGAAVSVATGSAHIGLGSDTGGSIRIPAALNGIVGFKGTARLVPRQGVLPLSTTLDTVGALTRSVRDALLVHEILTGQRVIRSAASLKTYRIGIATTRMLDGLDGTVASAWDRTLAQLRQAGAKLEEVPLVAIGELDQIQSTGGFSAAESYAWHGRHIENLAHAYDPRVLARIMRGSTMSAREYLELQQARNAWIRRMTLDMENFDAFISPTVPLVAPLIADLAPGTERDQAFFDLNGKLLRNPSMVNMLDGCAISLPCHTPDELPVGLMVWSGALCDDVVLNIARQIENLLSSHKTTTKKMHLSHDA